MQKITKAMLNQTLKTATGSIKLADYAGQYVVLYFYPKDSTPGCTIESQNFRDQEHAFKKHNAVILGVSKDSIKSHEKFAEKQCLPFPLISDEDTSLCQAFGVLKEKSMFGRKYMGIERSTFLINPDGAVIEEWRKVKVSGHVDKVLARLQSEL